MHEVNTTTPRTDPAEFISDMDGGSLESMLAVALSETAAEDDEVDDSSYIPVLIGSYVAK